jgi:membrane associated rhomboid family serine protease
MNDAPVGFQCPVCVKEGRASAPRTMTGARMARQSGAISFFLVAVNVLVYAVHGPGDAHHFDWALRPNFVHDHDQYYRLFSAGFVHFGVLHIAFNMVALASIGPQLEAMLGRWRFAVLYVLSLLGGSALSYLLLPVFGAGGGASGAIFGLMGGLLVVARRMNYDTRQLNGWIVYSLVFSFIPGIGIDWRAHVGGLVTGAALTYGMVRAPKQRRLAVQAGLILAAVLVIGAVIVVRTATFPAHFPV